MRTGQDYLKRWDETILICRVKQCLDAVGFWSPCARSRPPLRPPAVPSASRPACGLGVGVYAWIHLALVVASAEHVGKWFLLHLLGGGPPGSPLEAVSCGGSLSLGLPLWRAPDGHLVIV